MVVSAQLKGKLAEDRFAPREGNLFGKRTADPTEMFYTLKSGLDELIADVAVLACAKGLEAASGASELRYLVCGAPFYPHKVEGASSCALVFSRHGFWIRTPGITQQTDEKKGHEFRLPSEADLRGMIAAGYTVGGIRDRIVTQAALVESVKFS